MKNERWFPRIVTDMQGTFAYGCIRFDGHTYEPNNPDGFIRIGDRVEVRRLVNPLSIVVRKIYSDGRRGGEETWTK